MTIKQFKKAKIVTAFVVALAVSQSIVLKNYYIPIIVVVASSLILLYLRSRVTDIIFDERDYALGGRAALLTIQVYGWFATVIMLVLYSQRDNDPTLEAIALTLAFSACALMFLYVIIYRLYQLRAGKIDYEK